MAYDYNYLYIGLAILASILLVLFFRSMKKAILRLFGGSIELSEAGGVVCMVYLGYMIYQEAHRATLEFHVYNELYILFIAGGAMTGLGLKHALDTYKEIKLGNSGNSTITNTNTQTQSREVKQNESGE